MVVCRAGGGRQCAKLGAVDSRASGLPMAAGRGESQLSSLGRFSGEL